VDDSTLVYINSAQTGDFTKFHTDYDRSGTQKSLDAQSNAVFERGKKKSTFPAFESELLQQYLAGVGSSKRKIRWGWPKPSGAVACSHRVK
jgi:hypothetical protein